MTTENEIWGTLETLVAVLEAKGAKREGWKLMATHGGLGPGYELVWVTTGGGQTRIVAFGDSKKRAREQAWDMIRLLDALPNKEQA